MITVKISKNGMGATITNFLSKFFIVESYRMDGSAGKVEFEEGRINSKGLQKIKKPPAGKHGLITSFAPSEMMGNIDITDEQIEKLTWELCHLSRIGTKITLNMITPTGAKRKAIIENKHGIFDMLGDICYKSLFEPIYFSVDNGTMAVEVLLTYDIAAMDDPEILSYANMCPTRGGTHVDGFLDGLVRYFRDYMNTHEEAAKAYADLKKELCAKYPEDRGSYLEGKSDLVCSLLSKAKKWRLEI